MGKTNLLEAVYYLSFGKSPFNPVDSQNIRRGADFFAIHGTYRADGGEEPVQVACTLRKGHPKKIVYNKKSPATLAEHIGRIPLVLVTPGDQNLLLGGSEVRRRFMDGIISQTDPVYLDNLLSYSKAVQQRNILLKSFYENRYFEEEHIAVWDEQLVRYGLPLMEARKEFLTRFEPLFEQYYALIHPQAAGGEEKPQVTSVQTLAEEGAEAYAAGLQQSRQRDAMLQYTTLGPHRDDLDFTLSGFSLKRAASQGQQKTFLLALKLAQFEYIHNAMGTKPILLLDDIFDKLDIPRVKRLLMLVGSDRFGQVFITDTQEGRVESIFQSSQPLSHTIIKL